jgi:lipid II:glycine glycyltransferase (peptidoglycan interpeptide bridge formation enzyme)
MKALREGVQVETRMDVAAIDEFHRLDVLTRKRQGVPPHPRRFLHNLHRYLIQTDRGFIIVARVGRKIIGSYLYLLHNKTIYYKYGASDERYFRLRINHLLIWEAMKWGTENGYTRFHFGRSDATDRGLRQFKSKPWGSVESPLPYSHWSAGGSVRNRTGKQIYARMRTAVFKRVPSSGASIDLSLE